MGQGEGQGKGGDSADVPEVMWLCTTSLPHIMVLDRSALFCYARKTMVHTDTCTDRHNKRVSNLQATANMKVHTAPKHT